MNIYISSWRLICVVVMISAIAACNRADEQAAISEPVHELIEGTGVTATVLEEDGKWSVQYVFAEPQLAMLFSRSSGGYRAGQWTATSPGVKIETLGGFDAIVFEAPQRRAHFNFIPYTEDIPKDYTPFIRFSDGALAMYTGQFEVLPSVNAQAIAALEGDLSVWQGEQPVLGVRLVSDKPMIVDGARESDMVQTVSKGGGKYVYVGEGQIEEGASFIGVIDRELPAWLRQRFDSDLGNIFRILEEKWGYPLPEKATVLFAFKGYAHSGFSNQGGVLGNMLALESSGAGMREEDETVLAYLHWFFAHEAVHLFQRGKGIMLANHEDAWIHEGAANTMAHHVADVINERIKSPVETYAPVVQDCTGYLSDGPLRDAAARGQFNAYYECGDLIALMTDAALPSHTLYDFWILMQEAAAAESKERVDATLYFATLEKLDVDEELIKLLRSLVEDELDDPAAHLTAVMSLAGLAPVFDDTGALTAIVLPQ